MLEPGLGLALVLSMAAVHLLGEELEEYISGYREELESFTAGASVTYIFLQLLPEFQKLSPDSTLVYVFPLVGFSSIHLVEKHLQKSEVSPGNLREDYAEVHSLFLFLYHAALGYLLISLLASDTVSGLLFALPLLMHIAVSSFSISELHEDFMEKPLIKVLLAASPVLGAALNLTGSLTESQFIPVFGAVTGMFFYVTVRDSIPEGKKGKPVEYVAGLVSYLVLLVAVQMI